jgi:hypothetical protein
MPKNTTFSTTYYSMAPCRFGTEISGNRVKNAELSAESRAAIIAKYEARVKVVALRDEFRVGKTAINDTIKPLEKPQNTAIITSVWSP